MLRNLVLHKGSFAYIRFKALIWQSNCLIKHQTVLQSSIKLLEEVYNSVYEDVPLVVSLKGIVDTERPLENFFSEVVKKSKRPIIFVHNQPFADNIIQSICRLDLMDRPKLEYDPAKLEVLKVNCSASEDKLVNNLIAKIDAVEQELLKKIIKNCHKKVHQKRLVSTVVSTNIEFDAAKIISEPSSFVWICLFIADKITEYLNSKFKDSTFDSNTEIKLLAVSLRGSPFASAVSYLINKGYDTIDHLGPKHKLFDIELFENFKSGVQYIYIGDFVVGGTEIKIAKAYTELLGCELNHAIVLSSLLDPEVFKEDFTLLPLTRILDIIPEAEYKLVDTNDQF